IRSSAVHGVTCECAHPAYEAGADGLGRGAWRGGRALEGVHQSAPEEDRKESLKSQISADRTVDRIPIPSSDVRRHSRNQSIHHRDAEITLEPKVLCVSAVNPYSISMMSLPAEYEPQEQKHHNRDQARNHVHSRLPQFSLPGSCAPEAAMA